MGRRCVHVLVSGLVQGVAFRWWTREAARELGLAGWVKNLPDGRVELRARGRARDVDELLARLRHGPPAAHVTDLRITDEPAVELDGQETFEVRR